MAISPEMAVLISSIISLGVASIPKLIDVVFGARIVRRKEEADREAAYRQKVFEDAAQARADRAALQADLLAERDRLEKKVRELEDTWSKGLEHRADKETGKN